MKYLRKFGEKFEISDEQESELMNIFSERGWNLVDHRVEFYENPNKNLSGKSGTIKSVKSEVATVDIDGKEYQVPFNELLDKNLAKIYRKESPFKSGPGFEYKTIDDYPQSVRLIYNRLTPDQKKFVDDNVEKFAKVAKKMFYKGDKDWKKFFTKETKKIDSLSELINSMNSYMI